MNAAALEMNITNSALRWLLVGLIAISLTSCTAPEDPVSPLPSVAYPDPVSVDTLPPDPVGDALFSFTGDSGLVLGWSYPVQTAGSAAVVKYEVRFSYAYTDIESFWALSKSSTRLKPVSTIDGNEQCVIPSVQRGKRIHAAIRSVDATGKLSDIGNLATYDIPGLTISAQCLDAFTGDPVPGLAITVVSGRGFRHLNVTDENGVFKIKNMEPGGTGQIIVSSGASAGTYHRVTLPLEYAQDSHRVITMIPLDTNLMANTGHTSVLSVLTYFYATGPSAPGIKYYEPDTAVLYKWQVRPLPVYVPHMLRNGFDYRDGAAAAIEAWNSVAGEELYVLVDQPVDTGIDVKWKSSGTAAYEHVSFQDDGLHPRHGTVSLNFERYQTFEGVRLVLSHEFGHAHRWGHAINNFYVMTGGTANTIWEPTEDERRARQLMSILPDATDLSIYHLEEF